MLNRDEVLRQALSRPPTDQAFVATLIRVLFRVASPLLFRE